MLSWDEHEKSLITSGPVHKWTGVDVITSVDPIILPYIQMYSLQVYFQDGWMDDLQF